VSRCHRDNITGNTLSNYFLGGGGNDTLSGAGGNDLLNGGAGNDSLNGGTGLDTFYFTGAALTGLNTVGTILGTDTIADFTVGVDKIALSKTTFSALSGALGTMTAADFAVVANDSLAGGSAAAIVYSTGSGKLFYNADRATFNTVPPLNTPINSGLGYSGGNFAVLPAIGAVYPTLSAANFTIIA
jgi:Ca2+-binding RTX toxin-like protein